MIDLSSSLFYVLTFRKRHSYGLRVKANGHAMQDIVFHSLSFSSRLFCCKSPSAVRPHGNKLSNYFKLDFNSGFVGLHGGERG